MYQLQFTLKQHTPIIHFQHEQDGATLRATEVKPKLDRFIIERLGGKDKIDNSWFISDKHDALDYKIRIRPTSNNSIYLPLAMSFSSNNYPNRDKNLISTIKKLLNYDVNIIAPSLYFANSDKIKFSKYDKQEVDNTQSKLNELVYAFLSNEEINGFIISPNIELKNSIETHLSEFFLLHNFGTRQNKGFGSFTVTLINNSRNNITNPGSNIFDYKSNNTIKNITKIFEFIKEEYQVLKSGTNRPTYNKSEIFKYYIKKQDKPIRWEKRYFKQFINSNKIDSRDLFKKRYEPIDTNDITKQDYNDYNDKQTNDYKFVRTLLGLAEQYEFLITDLRNNENQDFANKYIVTIKHHSGNIERFQSPILFKVIDGCVYLKSNESYKKLLKEEFKFTLKLKQNPAKTKSIPNLKVPDHFDINDFLKHHISSNWISNF